MTGIAKIPRCPHCGQPMQKWRVPINSTWPHEFFHVCFNDLCPYYRQGWERMRTLQGTHASYRCRWDPDSGQFVPLPVWSVDALKNGLIEDENAV